MESQVNKTVALNKPAGEVKLPSEIAPTATPKELGSVALGEGLIQPEAPKTVRLIGEEVLKALREHPLYVGDRLDAERPKRPSGL